MKKLRKALSLLMAGVLLLSLILSIATTAFAATQPKEKAETCSVIISLIDQSGDFPGTSFQVTFKSEAGEETIPLEKDQSWGVGKVVTRDIPADEYTLSFKGLPKDYTIINTLTKAAPEAEFEAKAAETKSFYWAITKTENQGTQTGPNAATQNGGNSGNKEAEKAFTEFLSAVAFIETDPSWSDGFSDLLNQYGEDSFNHDLYSKWYEAYVQGGTKEKYLKMSAFEQFLWTETYTRLANAKNSAWGYDYFFGSKEAFASSVTDLVVATMAGNDSDTVKEAYLKLMDWQYDYIMKYNEPFNFISNRSYREEMKAPAGNKTDEEKPSDAEKQEQSLEETQQPEEPGIWDETFKMIAQNAISVIILIVLGAAIFAIYYVRKNKNIDGDN